ncbi:MAG: SEL1-like repeat protein [Nitrospirae bacterium]|nr:SEL1-like repeat protein [Nitrospirota bacterium]
MRKILITIICLIGLSVSYSYAGNMEDAKTASDKKDYKTAYDLYLIEAEKGNAEAQNNLGARYANGLGVKQEFKEALKWYKLAAAQGYAQAEYNIGIAYFSGQGVAQDYREALKWFQFAAAKRNASADNLLGVMYTNGLGVMRNIKAGFDSFKAAVELGDSVAKCNLAEFYAKGIVITQNLAMAHKLTKEGFDSGEPYCKEVWEKYNLANYVADHTTIFTFKDGLIDDPELGFQWMPAPSRGLDQYQAEEYARNLSIAGGGWRLPTMWELKSLYDQFQIDITDPIRQKFNVSSCPAGCWVWTSEFEHTTNEKVPIQRARYINFADGYDGMAWREGSRDYYRVLAVRSKR